MLAEGLDTTAETADGAVEAFEGRGGQLHGVQWHPEKMIAEVCETQSCVCDSCKAAMLYIVATVYCNE